MKKLVKTQVIFSVNYTGNEIEPENKIFELLSSPKEINQIFTDIAFSDAYSGFFNKPVYEDKDFTTYQHEVMNWISDTGDGEFEILFGFEVEEDIKKGMIRAIYKDILISLVNHLFNEDMKLSSKISVNREYTTTESEFLEF